MEEGTIVRWLKRNGDEVVRGEELVEIETDKATLAYESDTAGTLQITAQEGATLPVGARIALIGGDDSVPSVAPAAVPPPAKTASGPFWPRGSEQNSVRQGRLCREKAAPRAPPLILGGKGSSYLKTKYQELQIWEIKIHNKN